jgi:flavin reductase (DIM6/NTAB) family NADH-FMN oxidoreductase RutF
MLLNASDLQQWDTYKKVQLITSLPGPKPICLLGTRSRDGVSNLAPFSSITHLGSSPALIGFVTRPDTVERHSLTNILDSGSWTLNHINPAIIAQAHQCSAKYPAHISEFAATGLTEQNYSGFEAPAVKQAHIKFGLTLQEVIPIKTNDTKLVVGSVEWIDLDERFLLDSGGIDLCAAQSMASTALDTYFTLTSPQSFPYARP